MSGPQSDLFTGLAGIINAASVGKFVASGIYSSSDQWAVTAAMVPSSPPTIICLTTYPVQDDAKLNDSVFGVQVQLRGTEDPRSVIDKGDEIFNLFQGLENRDFGSLHLALLWRQSGTLNGQDDLLRWTSFASYYARVNVPTLYRTE